MQIIEIKEIKAEGSEGSDEGDHWITVNGQHILVGGDGEPKAGNTSALGHQGHDNKISDLAKMNVHLTGATKDNAEHVEKVHETAKDLNKYSIVKDVHKEAGTNLKLVDGLVDKGSTGVFERGKDKDTIELTTNKNGKPYPTEDKLTIGGKTVGDNIATNYRHEVGHKIYIRASENRSMVNGREMSLRTDWNNTSSKVDASLVSKYASTNQEELFSESFAAYTSPQYGKDNQVLPTEIHDFMGRWIK